MVTKKPESEWLTRKRRIDPKLNAVWILPPPGAPAPLPGAHRSEEEPTANGPADYALWLDGAHGRSLQCVSLER
jgi:hypothetical protein